MTNEELDKARVVEAWRIYDEAVAQKLPFHASVVRTVARLAREGWTPPPPVDPDLLAVREIVAKVFDEKGWHDAAGEARKGQTDKGATLLAALAAYKAGREAETERAKVLLEALNFIEQSGGSGPAGLACAALEAYKAGKEAGK